MIAEVFEVEGVHCPRCIETIAAALADIDGLLAADANLMGEISVRSTGPTPRARAGGAGGRGFPVASVRPLPERRQGRSSATSACRSPACERDAHLDARLAARGDGLGDGELEELAADHPVLRLQRAQAARR